ncbi:outer membrane protein assembly factor BamB family protein [Neolewinella agarilytica]|nr:PQQ-binding-like beta-propeller repeat protein [Neolewinella agarilytica]
MMRFCASAAIFMALLFTGCAFEGDQWVADFKGVGSSSSPGAADLNGDGILDIVIGGSGTEFKSIEHAVMAIDGATGATLWTVGGHNQMVGSPTFKDINEDGTDDVVIGGRSGMLFALEGTTGEKLWEFLPYQPTNRYVDDTTILNFFNLQWTPDQNDDGFPDLLAPYGGFVKAKPGDPNRPAGYLLLISGKNGATIAKARVPDGRETYLSPLLYDFGQGLEVIFGTGGEDLPGSLYRAPLSAVKKEDLSMATNLLSGGSKGFIAPPILAKVTEDDIPEIIVCTVDGRMVCLDGQSNSVLWSASPGGDFDTYVMPAPGHFTGEDDILDFFASYGKGAWPNTDYTLHTLVDGKTGQIVFTDTLGTFQYASPIVADFTKDGKHDVMLSINYLSTHDVIGDPTDFYNNGLYIYTGGQGAPRQAFDAPLGSNLGSTPLITDLDGDGKIDMVTAYMSDPQNFYSFKNLKVERREINRSADGIFWGNYMGPDGKATVE